MGSGEYEGFAWAEQTRATSCLSNGLFRAGCEEYTRQIPASEKCGAGTADGVRARRAGGIQRSRRAAVLPADTPDSPLANSNDVALLIADAINTVRRGELDPRIANAISYLASVQLRCFEQSALEDRMTKIETTMGLIPRPMFHLKEELSKESDEKPQD